MFKIVSYCCILLYRLDRKIWILTNTDDHLSFNFKIKNKIKKFCDSIHLHITISTSVIYWEIHKCDCMFETAENRLTGRWFFCPQNHVLAEVSLKDLCWKPRPEWTQPMSTPEESECPNLFYSDRITSDTTRLYKTHSNSRLYAIT